MNKSFVILLILVIFLGAGFGGSFVGGVIYGQTLEDEAENGLSPRLGPVAQTQGGNREADLSQRGQGRRGQGTGPGSSQAEGTLTDSRRADSQEDSESGRGRQRQASGAEPGVSEQDLAAPAVLASDAGASGEQLPRGERSGRTGDSSQEAGEKTTPTVPAAAAQPEGPGSGEQGAGTSATGGRRSAGARGGAAGTIQSLEGDVLTVASAREELVVNLSDTTTIFQVSEATREELIEGVTVRVSGPRNPEGVVAAQSVVILPEGAADLFGAPGPGGRQRRSGP